MKHLVWIFSVVLFLSYQDANAQVYDKNGNKMILVNVVIENGDTIPVFHMAPVTIVATQSRKNRQFMRKYNKLKKRIIKVYPYATLAAQLMDQYEHDLAEMDSKKDRKKYVKEVEKQLKEDFAGILKKMTISEGRILIKLIDRQTSRTTYELLDELKGDASAFMWQGVARLFGSNLKTHYDPVDEDFLMESIVRKIESGEIALASN